MNKVLKLDFNERSDATSPLANNEIYGKDLWRYPDRTELETKIAELNSLSLAQVLCTNGGDEGIMILMRLIKESSKLILPLPAFSQYAWGVESWQLDATLIEPKTDLSIDIDKTIQAISETQNAVTIITRPNNPTGEFIPFESLLSILEVAKQNQGWVFLDEAYIEFSEAFYQTDESSLKLLEQFDNLVILRTFSKAFGLAGIRLGYLFGSEKLIQEFAVRCMPFNVPQPSLTVALTALDTINQQEVKSYCNTIIQNRKRLLQWFADIGVEALSSQANFVTIRLPKNQAQAVKSFLKKNNVLVRSFNDELLGNCLRITIPFRLEQLLTLLKQALQPTLVCLDMDGVLIDTSGSYDATVIATVKELGNFEVSSDDINQVRSLGGYNNDWVLSQKLLADRSCNFSLEEVTQAFQKIYLGANGNGLVNNEKTLISTDLINTVNQINSKGKSRFAVVTGRPREEANAGSQLVGFNAIDIISLDDVEEAKPSPEGIKKLQNKYSNFSWMCGDNPDDMQAANASNSLAIGIGKQSKETLYQAGADIVLNNINELEEWLCPIR